MKALRKTVVLIALLALMLSLVSLVSFATEDTEEVAPESEIMLFEESSAKAIIYTMLAVFGIAIPLFPLGFVIFKMAYKNAKCEPIDYLLLGISVLWIGLGIALILIFAL